MKTKSNVKKYKYIPNDEKTREAIAKKEKTIIIAKKNRGKSFMSNADQIAILEILKNNNRTRKELKSIVYDKNLMDFIGFRNAMYKLRKQKLISTNPTTKVIEIDFEKIIRVDKNLWRLL